MNKKKGLKILKFPTDTLEAERQVEAILFAAEEPLDLKSIQTRLDVKGDVPKILKSLDKYSACVPYITHEDFIKLKSRKKINLKNNQILHIQTPQGFKFKKLLNLFVSASIFIYNVHSCNHYIYRKFFFFICYSYK